MADQNTGEASHILSIVLKHLDSRGSALWAKYHVAPLRSIYATEKYEDSYTYRIVTVVACDRDNVVFYDGVWERFKFGRRTEESDGLGGRIIEDLAGDRSECSDLQIALDREWNPEYYSQSGSCDGQVDEVEN